MIPRFRAARSALAIAVAAIALGGAPARAQLYLPALGQLPDVRVELALFRGGGIVGALPPQGGGRLR